MSLWNYEIAAHGSLRVKEPPRPPVAGSQGIFWVLADDGECYGVEAVVLWAMDERHRISVQTATPLSPTFWSGSAWALLVEGEVVGYGP